MARRMRPPISDRLHVAISDRELARWVGNRRPDVAYMGFVNRGNVGDEAMRSAHLRLLKGATVHTAPLHRPGRKLVKLVRGAPRILLVGGGTILGHDGWARAIRQFVEVARVERLVVFGPGMDDASFSKATGLSTQSGLRQWAQIFNRASFVGVRGPRSQLALSDLGVDSVVVGDPALLLDVQGSREVSPTVALNVTNVSNGYPGAKEARSEALHAARVLAERGYAIVGVSMDSGDLEAIRTGAAEFGVPLQRLWRPKNPQQLLAQLQVCTLVISERLHGAVLAATVGRPFLHLGYKPKSRDFTESVEASEWLLDVDSFKSGEALARIDNDVLSTDALLRVNRAVEGLRKTFRSYYGSAGLV